RSRAIEKLFEATKDLQSLEEIKPYCERFNEWINTNTNYSVKSLGTVLSRAGFYKKFKSLTLEQGKNAESVPKYDAQGNVTGNELKHHVLVLCGLDKEDWEERNETTRVSDRLTNPGEDGNTGIEINPDTYLQVTLDLLTSSNPNKLAVGLIAATGRRPHEILARGKFTTVDGEAYQVNFEGQGKKRGEKPVFKISTLYPASYVIERLEHLRKNAELKELIEVVSNKFPDDISAQNKDIEDKRGNSLRRVVQEYFGGKDTEAPLLNFRHGQDQNSCTALRAACACLVTERDCKGSLGAKMYFAACFLGHITPGENISDKDLKHIATTIGYSDYYTTKAVSFPDAPTTSKAVEKEKLTTVRVSAFDLEAIHHIREELQAPNQQSVINQLIESFNSRLDVAKKLESAQQKVAELEAQVKQLQESNNQLQENHQKLEASNNQLQQEKTAMETTTSQNKIVTLNDTDLESWLETKIIEVVGKVTQKQTIAPATTATPAKVAPPKVEIDWQAKSDADVWVSKTPEAAQEKIRRSYQAITLYNDTVATENDNRLAITNQALRELSGCNGLLVRDWIQEHKMKYQP
ncbi:protelomerase family protein, partial [Nostoc sp. 'Peltigera malacea cyanobiont' DB3992]|uniref:protelomerase family protein n=1 Tax=Nostoc sp. 'Peltigera malacea cyanobiont' DB3992 TaxID=1206980 RepID=UPI000C04B0D5